MRAQFLNGERFYTLKEAQILMERWRVHYNTVRPHGSLGGQPPNHPACELRTHMVGGTKTPGWSPIFTNDHPRRLNDRCP